MPRNKKVVVTVPRAGAPGNPSDSYQLVHGERALSSICWLADVNQAN